MMKTASVLALLGATLLACESPCKPGYARMGDDCREAPVSDAGAADAASMVSRRDAAMSEASDLDASSRDAASEPDGGPPNPADGAADAGNAPDPSSSQIAMVRAAIRGALAWPSALDSLVIDSAIVTYVKAGFGGAQPGTGDGPGFFVQNEDIGPALFVALNPTDLVPGGVQVGDRLKLVVTEGTVWNALVLVSGATAQRVGDSAALPAAQDLSTLGLLPIPEGDYELESELATCVATVTGPFAPAGDGFSAAPITTAGQPATKPALALRVPSELVVSLSITTGCVITISRTPVWRTGNNLQLSAWNLDDAEVTCPPLLIADTYPASASEDVPVRTPIRVTFNQPLGAAGLSAQAAAGPCTGNIQISNDYFASCIGLTADSAELDSSRTIATVFPTETFTANAYHHLRIASGVVAASGNPLSLTADFVFKTTAELATCDKPVVISQVYGGGGNAGAPILNDFVELHNRGAAPINIGGWSLQIGTSSTWTVQPLPYVTVPGGGYYLVSERSGGGSGSPLEGIDATGPFALGARTGRMALVAGTDLLTSSASVSDPRLVDFVSYGASPWTDPNEGSPTSELSSATAALRVESGCKDTDSNLDDFSVETPAPRNSSTQPMICACSAGP